MIRYGGDYNPEQWPEDVWADDIRLMKQAGVNFVSLGIFSWAMLEPREGEFELGWLDRVVDALHAAGIRIDLATATASPPPWLTHRYPEVLPVTEDGIRLSTGGRQQYCPSSPVYRRFAARLVATLAERYGSHPAVELWHVNNEYGCHVSRCYCDVSAEAFRDWLRARYTTIENLNAAWGTVFWSQRYSDFAEILPPRKAPTFRNPAQLLDFDRFGSDQLLGCYRAEVAVLRRLSPSVPVTTNFMGFFKGADYWTWAKEVDVVSNDCYPDPADPGSPAFAAMSHDLMRSLGHGRPWLLMEQAPSGLNWRTRNAPKAPGQMRAWSLQAVARGADGVLFFQWRQSVAGSEKFHSGMVPHAGTDSRTWREVVALGAELKELAAVEGSTVTARVAIVMDWDSWWSIEQTALPTKQSYLENLSIWYRELFDRNVAVDFVPPTADLTRYALVVAPTLFVTGDEALENLHSYVRGGGHLVVTYQSGITDETARIVDGGYLGRLQETLGVRIEEFAPFAGPDLERTGAQPVPHGRVRGPVVGGECAALVWAEVLQARGAQVQATFAGGPLDGSPAITRNEHGAGVGWYVATLPDADGRRSLVAAILDEVGLVGELSPPVAGLEAVRRGRHRFLVNHGLDAVTVAGRTIEAQGVEISLVEQDPVPRDDAEAPAAV